MISLLTFIQTGRLGEIGLGSSRTEVELSFGPPDAWDARFSWPRARIWKYGDFEFHFDYERLWLIFTDAFDGALNMGQLPFDSWKIRSGVTQAEVANWLEEEGVAFQKGWGMVPINNDEGSHWILSSQGQVTLRFDEHATRERLTSLWRR